MTLQNGLQNNFLCNSWLPTKYPLLPLFFLQRYNLFHVSTPAPHDSRAKDPIISPRHKSWSIYTNCCGLILTASIWLQGNHVNCGQWDMSEHLLGASEKYFFIPQKMTPMTWLMKVIIRIKVDYEFIKVEKYSRDTYVSNYLKFICSMLLKNTIYKNSQFFCLVHLSSQG